MKIYALRLKPGDNLRESLLAFAARKEIKAGSISTCVGGLESVQIRMAGATPGRQDVRDLDGPFEIVSLVGTLTAEDCHLHLSVSDSHGKLFGGHLKSQSRVGPTCEIVLMEDEESLYLRERDSETGFDELVVVSRD